MLTAFSMLRCNGMLLIQHIYGLHYHFPSLHACLYAIFVIIFRSRGKKKNNARNEWHWDGKPKHHKHRWAASEQIFGKVFYPPSLSYAHPPNLRQIYPEARSGKSLWAAIINNVYHSAQEVCVNQTWGYRKEDVGGKNMKHWVISRASYIKLSPLSLASYLFTPSVSVL